MKRRTWASLLAFALVIGLTTVAASRSVPYVTFAPGPTVNVLGKYDDKDIINVSGRRSYRDDGGLRLTTVIPSGPEQKVNLLGLVAAWVDPDRSVYPYDSVYAPQDTRQSVRDQSGLQMTSSQDNAVAAALSALGIRYGTVVAVAEVEKGGPADGKLEKGDLIRAVDGKRVRSVPQVTGAVRPLKVGSRVALRVERDGEPRTVTLRTAKSSQDPRASAVKVQIGETYTFPFDVSLTIDENIGGPSGGLMFAMGIYDVLTPGSLTDGKVIAGTGEIDGSGEVGEIGGIQQKLVGAQEDGARLFLVPAGNCAEALGGHYDPDRMRLVRVNTLKEALADVKAWVKDPGTELPRCTR